MHQPPTTPPSPSDPENILQDVAPKSAGPAAAPPPAAEAGPEAAPTELGEEGELTEEVGLIDELELLDEAEVEGASGSIVPIGRAPRLIAALAARPAIEAAPNLVAAVDLGSNSFHMVIARASEDGQAFSVVDRLRENVRLGAGIDPLGRLTPEVQERALATLRVFGQRLANLSAPQVRAVATNTLRQAQNAEPFLRRATVALGHDIDIISGREEARLIYRGVSHDLHQAGRRLVVDIGGGSTELIIGEGGSPIDLESRQMGCVTWSLRFFPEGRITRRGHEDAVLAARLELQACKRRLLGLGWQHAVGSSGTINAIAKMLSANGLGAHITREGINELWKRLLSARRMDRVQLNELPERRRAVLPGGLAVLEAVFSALKIEEMDATQGALREGVMLDLLGARRHEDVRESTILTLTQRYGVERDQSQRVEATALLLFEAVAMPWALGPAHRALLGWAARLHEAGVFVNHSGFHKHGAYILKHADLPGFSRQEQAALGALVLCQRGNATEARVRDACSGGPPQALIYLIALLRIATRLHRSRSTAPISPLDMTVNENIVTLIIPRAYMDAHPLTRAELQAEADQLPGLGLALLVAER